MVYPSERIAVRSIRDRQMYVTVHKRAVYELLNDGTALVIIELRKRYVTACGLF